MTDITERLRDLARNNGYRGIGEYWNACEEAADEIDRLRARVAELRGYLARVHNCIESQHLPEPLRVAVADAVAKDGA